MPSAASNAKVNLALHITGRRLDGYHLLDSIVVFPDIADKLEFNRSEGIRIETSGMHSEHLPDNDAENLVVKAARLLTANPAHQGDGISIRVQKKLPVSAGIGGGSANAATALNMLNRLWNMHLEPKELSELAESLGADVPVCLSSTPARIQGTGEAVTRFSNFPTGSIVLANPNIPLPTSKVFAQLKDSENSALPPFPHNFGTLEELTGYLENTRNDLEAPARELVPLIGNIIEALKFQPGCLHSGMSGSGATCFGLFKESATAESACSRIRTEHPDWWVESGSF